MNQSDTPDGWYADPEDPSRERWWASGQWSDITRGKFTLVPNRAAVLVLSGLVLAAFLIYAATRWPEDSGGGTRANRTYDVMYQVDGTATSADLTLTTANGGTSQQQDVALPIKNSAGQDGLHITVTKGTFVYISAQNNGGGTITCHIFINGLEAISNTSSGEYTIASCSGRVQG
jgi:hypothetical protein